MNEKHKNLENVSIEQMLKIVEYQKTEMKLPCVIGVTDDNKPFLFDLTKMPHVIIAGAPWKGLDNMKNAILMSLLQKKSPEELKLVLIDVRMVDFMAYEMLSSRYLARLPYREDSIISNIQDAINALNSLCELMQERYDLLYKYDARNIEDYNRKYKKGEIPPQTSHGIMPYYVVMINELGDFMMTAGKDFEFPLIRLAQLSRTVGMHIVVSTIRPIIDVINGSIKANFPCRMAFRTRSVSESKIIIDRGGAEYLSDNGDVLFVCYGSEPIHLVVANVDESNDIPALCTKITQQYVNCPQTLLPDLKNNETETKKETKCIGEYVFQYADPLFEEVVKTIVENQFASTSFIQRKYGIGYNRADHLMDMAESAGIVSPLKNNTYVRDVLIADTNELMHKLLEIKKKEKEKMLCKR